MRTIPTRWCGAEVAATIETTEAEHDRTETLCRPRRRRPWLAQGEASFLLRPLLRPRAHGPGRAAGVERRRDRRRTPASRRTRTPTWRSSPMSAQGAITHEDSLGNKGRTEAGDVQVMSAGSGIRHAEYNREREPTTLFQIWIEPGREAAASRPGAPSPSPRRTARAVFVPLASGVAGDGDALPIRADARVLGATLKAGETARIRARPDATAISCRRAARRGQRRASRRARRRRDQRRTDPPPRGPRRRRRIGPGRQPLSVFSRRPRNS